MSILNLQRQVQMRDTKANCEALTGAAEEGLFAYATDTGQLGIYTGGAWVWLTGLTDEAIDDRVAALLVAGTGITLTYDDGANTLTIVADGSGGTRWEPLTNGDYSNPELIFVAGDVVMVPAL